MQDYEFEVTIVVVVRVWAENESLARGIVASSAPSPRQARMRSGLQMKASFRWASKRP
jgi:hypothetical protein